MAQIKPTNNWTSIPNTWLRDKSLSLKTKGLLCVMNSLPLDWTFTVEGLAAISKEGIDAVRAAIKEAESHGYLTREYVRDDQGHIIDTIYTLHEKSQQGGETPTTENPMSGSPPQYNKEEYKKEDTGPPPENSVGGSTPTEPRVVYLRVNPSGKAWKSQRVYSTDSEIERLEEVGGDTSVEFKYWKSPKFVGDDSKAKYKYTKAKLIQPDVVEEEATVEYNGKKYKTVKGGEVY